MKRITILMLLLLIVSIASFAQLKKHETYFDSNKRKLSKVWYTDSQNRLQGTTTEYNWGGLITETTQYKDNQLHGKNVKYDELARPAEISTYANHKMVSYEIFAIYNGKYICKQKLVYKHDGIIDVEEHKYNHITGKLEKVKYAENGMIYEWGCIGHHLNRDMRGDDSAIETFSFYAIYPPGEYESMSEIALAKKDTIYTWFDSSKTKVKIKDFYNAEANRAFRIQYNMKGDVIENNMTAYFQTKAYQLKVDSLKQAAKQFVIDFRTALNAYIKTADFATESPEFVAIYDDINLLGRPQLKDAIYWKFSNGIVLAKIKGDPNIQYFNNTYATTGLLGAIKAYQKDDKNAKIIAINSKSLNEDNFYYDRKLIRNDAKYTGPNSHYGASIKYRVKLKDNARQEIDIANETDFVDVWHIAANNENSRNFNYNSDTIPSIDSLPMQSILSALLTESTTHLKLQYKTVITFSNGTILTFVDEMPCDDMTANFLRTYKDKLKAEQPGSTIIKANVFR